ncbi:40S ribosomal protein S19 [Pseudoloma neurophilia]|uniref:40S ribosomal protein S19 n=1 Tax=Pseudoloma neurophilia TaxID=146866 RepID=A0A0R0LRE3_9MICR|nr:40S ribosomal protein S19 [Pseudoloma neurophilia]
MSETNLVYTVDPVSLITCINSHLSNNDLLTRPKYFNILKTSVGKQNAPIQNDWLYTRAASLLRKIACFSYKKSDNNYKNLLSKKTKSKDRSDYFNIMTILSTYGCKKDRGTRPGKKVRCNKTHIISILEDFKKLNWIKKTTDGHFLLTEAGLEFINEMVGKCQK